MRNDSQTDPIVITSADRIDLVCDGYEESWRRGDQPQLISYLDECAIQDRSALFVELLLVDWELRRDRGESPCWNEYLARYPGFAADIEGARFKYSADSPGTNSESANHSD